MKPLTLMVQGTTSDAGKSTLVAGLCRVLSRQGLSVAPFKPQNMALNSAVTKDGGEIGRAQALQAQASGIEPHTDMNPVLIKPSSDTGAQIIIQGQVYKNMDAMGFHTYKPSAQRAVLESYRNLIKNYDYVVVEGAGSPAEINLREGDIANMGFAEAVNCPVILIADIDKGGVFAHLVGTLELLSKSEQQRVIGFVINKFRGDIRLLKDGLDWLEKRTNKPVFGVLPYLKDFYVDAEDAIECQQVLNPQGDNILQVIVPVLPRISNHTDFDALRLHPNVNLIFVSIEKTPPPCDLIILPGSKNVCQDMRSLRENGWPLFLDKHLRYGGKVLGICGGKQMLGECIRDPYGIEGSVGTEAGFGYLPLESVLEQEKSLKQTHGKITLFEKTVDVTGYEIHHGNSSSHDAVTRCIELDDGSRDGEMSADGNIFATYIHGIFDAKEACQLLLQWSGLPIDDAGVADGVDVSGVREECLNRLVDTVDEYLDGKRLHRTVEDFYASGSTNSKTSTNVC